jgi:hypothetical protein
LIYYAFFFIELEGFAPKALLKKKFRSYKSPAASDRGSKSSIHMTRVNTICPLRVIINVKNIDRDMFGNKLRLS